MVDFVLFALFLYACLLISKKVQKSACQCDVDLYNASLADKVKLKLLSESVSCFKKVFTLKR